MKVGYVVYRVSKNSKKSFITVENPPIVRQMIGLLRNQTISNFSKHTVKHFIWKLYALKLNTVLNFFCDILKTKALLAIFI